MRKLVTILLLTLILWGHPFAQLLDNSSYTLNSSFIYGNETFEPFQELPPEVIKNLPPDINAQVAYFIKYYTTRGRRGLQKWFNRCGQFLPYFKAIFKEFGIPEDLVYLAVIESG